MPKRDPKPTRGRKVSFRIVWEDDDLVVVDKPVGLLSISTPRERHATLYRALFDRERKRRPGGRVFVVHRLDRDASGLLVVAKHEPIKRQLQAQFAERTASRTYRALVTGRFGPDEVELRHHLAENRAYRVYVTGNAARGQLAVTRARVVRRGAGCTLLEVRIETGRKHQIRVQLAAAGHPLVGDRRYGEDRAGPLGRLGLHATALELDHPRTGERLRFESRCPPSFERLLAGEPARRPRRARGR